jgi:predicted dehydrogenase
MARTVDECERMIAASAASGALLVPAHVVRFFPEHRAAHDVIARGDIGTPASVRLRRGGGAPKADWFLDIGQSGGILLDLAVHEFDWLLWTIGPAVLVTSRSVRLGQGVDGAEFRGDYALTTVSFANGCVAHVESTWMDPSGFRATIEACGPKGAVEYDSRDNPSLRTHTGTTVNENNYAPEDDPYFRQLSAFVAAAKGEAAPAVRAEEGMAAVRLATAAIESAETGEPVSLS